MAETKNELDEHVPECVEVKLAYDLSRIPILGYLFFGICYLICCIKLGRKNVSKSYWLLKASERLGLNKFRITLFEIVIVVAILAIIGVALVPTSGDAISARRITSQTNLETLRAGIQMYYTRTGTYPRDDLRELVTVRFNEGGREFTCFPAIPLELISTNKKESAERNPPNRRVYNKLGTEGGWFYDVKTGRVYINYNRTLGKEWGPDLARENPSQW